MEPNQAMLNVSPLSPPGKPLVTFGDIHRTLQSIDSNIPKIQARIDALEAEKDKLEAENASLHKQIDQLTDDLARAREGDL